MPFLYNACWCFSSYIVGLFNFIRFSYSPNFYLCQLQANISNTFFGANPKKWFFYLNIQTGTENLQSKAVTPRRFVESVYDELFLISRYLLNHLLYTHEYL